MSDLKSSLSRIRLIRRIVAPRTSARVLRPRHWHWLGRSFNDEATQSADECGHRREAMPDLTTSRVPLRGVPIAFVPTWICLKGSYRVGLAGVGGPSMVHGML